MKNFLARITIAFLLTSCAHTHNVPVPMCEAPKFDVAKLSSCPHCFDGPQKSISFERNSLRLTKTGETALSEAIKTLRQYPNIRFGLGGHAETTETNPSSLSEARANHVERALIKAGIASERIVSIQGYSAKRPLFFGKNCKYRNGQERADINRSVEINVKIKPKQPAP